MKCIKAFQFDVQDRVLIKEIERPGTIDSLLTNIEGNQYRVCYWHDGNRKQEWMYSWELEIKNE